MVAFAQLLWGVPSGGLLLNVHASINTIPDILAPHILSWYLEFSVGWKQQSMARGFTVFAEPTL